MRRIRTLIAALAAVPLMAAAQAGPGYTFTVLGTAGVDSVAAAINNNAGQVAGSTPTNATLWSGKSETSLGPASFSSAKGINDAGQVVGFSKNTGETARATFWSGTYVTELGSLGGRTSVAYGINDAGQVVGSSNITGNTASHATLWNGTSATDLGTLGGNGSAAYDINNAGQVVGSSNINSGGSTVHATLWNGTSATDLGTLGGHSSEATAINDAGQAVGWSYTTGNATRHATLWNGTSATDLGTLSGTGTSFAFAINSAGQVVGTSDRRATLWNGTSVFDLNSLLDAKAVRAGWVLIEATGINDSGWITGNAYNELTDVSHAFLLTAVPEPESYALMLVGLGIVGTALRRRRV